MESFWTQPKLSRRQLRWAHFLAQFDFDIVYIPGVRNGICDAWSRLHEVVADKDCQPEDYVQVPDSWDDASDVQVMAMTDRFAYRPPTTTAQVPLRQAATSTACSFSCVSLLV